MYNMSSDEKRRQKMSLYVSLSSFAKLYDKIPNKKNINNKCHIELVDKILKRVRVKMSHIGKRRK